MAPKKDKPLKLREALSIMQSLGVVPGQQRVYDERSGGSIQNAWYPEDRPNAGAMNLKDANRALRIHPPNGDPQDNMRLLPQNQLQPYESIYQDTNSRPKSKLGKALLKALPWVNRDMPGLPYGSITDGNKQEYPVQIPTPANRPKPNETYDQYLRRLKYMNAT